jgi:hypothetical protein
MRNFGCSGTARWDCAAVTGLNQYGAFYIGGNLVSLHYGFALWWWPLIWQV